MLRALLITGALLLVLAAAAVGGFWLWASRAVAAPGPLGEETFVMIERGSSVAAIARQLRDSGAIERPWLFRLAVRASATGTSLKAGEYALPAAISIAGLITLLEKGLTVSHQITIPEGLTVVEVAALIAAEEKLTGDIGPLPPEGSLLPETYQFARGDDRASLIRRMRRAMDQALAERWVNRVDGLPLDTASEALVLASIIEKETGISGERRKVAGVFINRLRIGMRLQADPTVVYALTEGKAPLGRALLRTDWAVESPWNTYQVTGLPPTPIANPGIAAIEAVLNPEPHNYLYFVADGTGGHAFAETLREHNRNVANWRRIRDGG